jgi:hypothetical protein
MNSVIDQLAAQLGVDPAQAEAGVGAFMKLAQEHSPAEFQSLLQSVPGAAGWFEQAAPAHPAAALQGGGGGVLGGVESLLGGLLGGGAPGGGGLGGLLGGLFGGGQPPVEQQPAGGGGWGDVLGGLLGGGQQAGAQPTAGAGIAGLLATLLQNGFTFENAARFLPILFGLLHRHAGSDVLGGLANNIPLLGQVLGGAVQQGAVAQPDPQAEGGGFDLGGLLGQVLGNR